MNMGPRILQSKARKSQLCYWVIIYEFHFAEAILLKISGKAGTMLYESFKFYNTKQG